MLSVLPLRSQPPVVWYADVATPQLMLWIMELPQLPGLSCSSRFALAWKQCRQVFLSRMCAAAIHCRFDGGLLLLQSLCGFMTGLHSRL